VASRWLLAKSARAQTKEEEKWEVFYRFSAQQNPIQAHCIVSLQIIIKLLHTADQGRNASCRLTLAKRMSRLFLTSGRHALSHRPSLLELRRKPSGSQRPSSSPVYAAKPPPSKQPKRGRPQHLQTLEHNFDWQPVLITLAAAGATTGTFLDGIHSRVQVLVYDRAPVVLGGLHSSAWVPPLLAVFYLVIGGLYIMADREEVRRGDTATLEAMQGAMLAKMTLSFG
jgi:hypothetical protein